MSQDKKENKVMAFVWECLKILAGFMAVIILAFIAGVLCVVLFNHVTEIFQAICSTDILGVTTCSFK